MARTAESRIFSNYRNQNQVRKNKDIDIGALFDFFKNSKYITPPNGMVQSNNQIHFFVHKRNVVRDMNIESTVLTSHFKKTKGALTVSCGYMTESSRVCRTVCFISAHLSARSALDQNPDPSRQTYFLRRDDDMYDVLHECDRWYKQIHGLVESELLPFNIMLEGDLNFCMIKKGQDHHFDEGEIETLDSTSRTKKLDKHTDLKKQDQRTLNEGNI